MSGDEKLNGLLARLASDPFDKDAWSELYTTMWPVVYGRIAQLLGAANPEVEDLSQEIFTRLLRRMPLSNLETAEELRRYIATMCRNLVTDKIRRIKKQPVLGEDATGGGGGIEAEADLPPPIDDVEFRDLIAFVAERLDGAEQEMMALWLRGESNREMAHRLGLTAGNTSTRLHRLRKKIAALLSTHFGG